MTPLELDQLVREIGDEVQRRLGAVPPAAPKANGFAPRSAPPPQGLAGLINLALLQPDATDADVRDLCRQARHHGFGSVCVQPCGVAAAVRELRGTKVKVAAVVGYPHGATLTPVKLHEAAQVLKLGAGELEMAVHTGALKSGDLDGVYTEIRLAAECAHGAGAALKVVAEMSLLGDEQNATLCALARLGGADAIKTSADVPGSAASAGAVALARRVLGGELGIEAAGGIDRYARLQEMLAAGATRVATAAGAVIVSEAGLR
jgi:deoxyribose-phosphate aldolase